MRGGIRRISDSLHVRFDIIHREDYCDAMVFCSSCHVNFYVFPKMCGREVEGAKFLFRFVRVSAVGGALPATLAWWILWRGDAHHPFRLGNFVIIRASCNDSMVYVIRRRSLFGLKRWEIKEDKDTL